MDEVVGIASPRCIVVQRKGRSRTVGPVLKQENYFIFVAMMGKKKDWLCQKL